MIDFNIDNYLRISWQDILLVCISTLLIVLFAKHFFWDKLLAFIDKRQALIQSNIDASKKLREEAMEEKKQYDAQIASAGAKANEIIDLAKKEAEAQKTQILDAAKNQAQNIQRAAQEDIERDKLKAQKEMKSAITEVALAAAGAILESEIDASKQQAILDQLIDQAGEGQW